MKLFKEYQLNLDIKCNLKIVDYLDISFDMNTGIYKPINKPNNKPLYINASSNHLPPVLKPQIRLKHETDSQTYIKKDYR